MSKANERKACIQHNGQNKQHHQQENPFCVSVWLYMSAFASSPKKKKHKWRWAPSLIREKWKLKYFEVLCATSQPDTNYKVRSIVHPVGRAVGKQVHVGESAVKSGANSVEANLATAIQIENAYDLDAVTSLLRTRLHGRSHKHMVIHWLSERQLGNSTRYPSVGDWLNLQHSYNGIPRNSVRKDAETILICVKTRRDKNIYLC